MTVMQPDTSDRRRFERVPVRSSARVHTQDRTTAARLLNLSLGGALIDLGTETDPGGRACIVTIPFGRDPMEALALPARVVRRTRGTLAVKWARPLNFDARFKIKRLVEQEQGSPVVLERPLPMLIWPAMSSGRPRPS
jgi:hypothetical protein